MMRLRQRRALRPARLFAIGESRRALGFFGAALLVPFLLLPLGAAPALRHVFTLDVARAVRARAIE